MTKQHKEKSKQRPLDNTLPFLSAGFTELVQFSLLGAEHFGEVIQLSHFFSKVAL